MKPIREVLKKTNRVVIKIGSSVLIDKKGDLSHRLLGGLSQEIAHIQKKGVRTALVTSGAIPAGMRSLGLRVRPHKMPELQACAAIGQPLLMDLYRKGFSRFRLRIAQILLSRSDLNDRTRFLNAKHTLAELFSRNVIPVINENDTVAVEEIRFGDNDNLASLVTNLTDADLLILLTDQDGFYTEDPRKSKTARRIPVVKDLDQETISRSEGSGSPMTVGGMKTKLEACLKAAQYGIPTIIANGKNRGVLSGIFRGEEVGTLFLPHVARLTARKHWIAHTLKAQGRLVIDDGARQALTDGKKSLLPSGIKNLEGKFSQGDAVDICGMDRQSIGRGLVAYHATEIAQIMGKKSSEIEKILGYKGPNEVIHRDDLVLL